MCREAATGDPALHKRKTQAWGTAALGDSAPTPVTAVTRTEVWLSRPALKEAET